MEDRGITVRKSEDISEWYSQVVTKAEVCDYAPVRGCMIIRPLGYAIWSNIVSFLDANIKKRGVKNAYFPTFIPESFFRLEAEHAEGFAPEVAWVQNKDDDTGERLALRPTSETIMYHSYARWIRSWRDLPLRLNQWCNIIRWEVKDVKMLIRSREFLWQEGHCVYRTEEECNRETLLFLEEYRKVVEDLLAVPVIMGRKTEREKFAGALRTYTIEGFMPDGKSLQLGTSHDLGKGFAKAFGIRYIGEDEKEHVPWQNSWGLSTRTMGAMIMVHSDDRGLVIPPRAAPTKTVVVPIIFKDSRDKVLAKAGEAAKVLGAELDDREEYSSGWKFNDWEMKGVPLRVEIGPKDVQKNQAVLVRRDTGEKEPVPFAKLKKRSSELLDEIQKSLYARAKDFLENSIVDAQDWNGFLDSIGKRKLVRAHFCGTASCEEEIKAQTGGATSRCEPLGEKKPKNKKCVLCQEPATATLFFSKNY